MFKETEMTKTIKSALKNMQLSLEGVGQSHLMPWERKLLIEIKTILNNMETNNLDVRLVSRDE